MNGIYNIIKVKNGKILRLLDRNDNVDLYCMRQEGICKIVEKTSDLLPICKTCKFFTEE